MPATRPGKLSVDFLAAFVVLLALFYMMVAGGQRGGDSFWDNLWLTVPILLAAVAAIASFFTGVWGIIRSRERSVAVFLSTGVGLLVLLFIVGEIAFPH